MSGSAERRALQHGASLPKKALAFVLSLLFALALVPTAAWAQLGSEDSKAESSTSVETVVEGEEPGEETSSDVVTSEEDAAEDEESTPIKEELSVDEPSNALDAEGGPSSGASTDSESAGSMPSPSNESAQPSESAGATPLQNEISVTASVIGRDAEGEPEDWAAETTFELPEGSTAADLSEALFEKAGLKANYGIGEWGWSLNDITSPNDPDLTLGFDEVTYESWLLYVNGKAADNGAGLTVLEPGDEVVWYYAEWGASLPDRIMVSGWMVGIDEQGHDQTWIPVCATTVPEGTTAAKFTEDMLKQAGVEADIYTKETHGYWMLNAVTSPSDQNRSLTYDPETGAYWQFFVNGEYSMAGAEQYTLEKGDLIVWYYGADGTMPDFNEDDDDVVIVDGVEVDADAERPNVDAQWPSYGMGAAPEGAQTPTEPTTEAWMVQSNDYVSDPLVVGDCIYVATGSQLKKISSGGVELGSAKLVAAIDSISRMVYSDGIIVVPMKGGRLQAITPDTLTTVWVTDELPAIGGQGKQQSLGTLSVFNGCVYYGTAYAGSQSSYSGYFTCVDLSNGKVLWSNANESAGYYWSGASFVGDKVVVGNDTGFLSVLDAATGETISSLNLGASVRSTAVEGTQEGTILVVTTDGVLHKVFIDAATGDVRELASVKFGSSSTSTPAVVDGKVYVGGSSLEGTPNQWGYVVYGGQLAVIDEATMTVEHAVTSYDGGTAFGGDSKSAPLVSKQSTGTYVYFTCNAQPGGVYCYRVGDAEATLVFTPDEDHQNYAMSSVVCGADGTLYYVNDSKTLFAISGNGNVGPDDEDDDNVDSGNDDNTGNTGNNNGGNDNGNGNGNGNNNGSSSENEDDRNDENSNSDDPSDPDNRTFNRQLGTSPSGLRDAASDDSDGSSDGEGSDDSSILMSAASSKAGKALLEGESASVDDEQIGGVPAWVPIAGLVVGAGGLVVAGVLVARLMRRG